MSSNNSPENSSRNARNDDPLVARAQQQVRALASLSDDAAIDSTGPPPAGPEDDSHGTLPDSFAGYRVLKEIHRGGQGVIYQALQESTRRKVAIKVMREGPFAGHGDRARFDREILVLSQLNHPSIVAIHDTGQVAGVHYFVMDYVRGQPLDVYMAGGKRTVVETLRLFAKICHAVNAAHLRGVIHRDLKPGNVRIDENGEPHILDFGLAKVAATDAEVSAMTITGQFVGSLPWAAPEQAEGLPSKIDTRTDVYALGVVLYQMLTSKLPYEVGGNIRDVLDRIIRAEPTRPRTLRRDVDDEVETIVLKCLQKERERRYQTAGEAARDVERYLRGEPIDAKRDSSWYLLKKSLRQYRAPALTGGCFVLLLASFSVAMGFQSARVVRERDRAVLAELAQIEQREVAENSRDESQSARREAESRADELQRTLYVSRIGFAQAAYENDDISRARRLLEQCPEALRGWEWSFLNWLADRSIRTITSPGDLSFGRNKALAPDGSHIVVGESDGTIVVYHAESGDEVLRFRAYEEEAAGEYETGWGTKERMPAISLVKFAPDRDRIFSCGTNSVCKLWDAHTGQQLVTFEGEFQGLFDVAFSPTGDLVAAASPFFPSGPDWPYMQQPGIRVWNTTTGELIQNLHDAGSDSRQVWRGVRIDFDSKGERLISPGAIGHVDIWNVTSGVLLQSFTAHAEDVGPVKFGPDGRIIASGSSDTTVKLWDAESQTLLHTLVGHTRTICALAFSPDGHRLASGSADGTIRIWDVARGRLLRTLKGHTTEVSELLFSSDGTRLFSSEPGATTKIWDLSVDSDFFTIDVPDADGLLTLDFAPDGSRLAADALVMNAVTGEPIPLLGPNPPRAKTLAFSPDGTRIAIATRIDETGSWQATIKLWDARTVKPLFEIRGFDGYIWDLAYSPDGKHIVAGGSPTPLHQAPVLKVFDVETREIAHVLEGHRSKVSHVEFSRDGRLILSAGPGGICVHDVASGECIFFHEGHWCSGTLSPDGVHVAVTDHQNIQNVLLFDIRTGEESGRFPVDNATEVTFSPDGTRLLVVRRWRHQTELWDTDTREQLLSLPTPRGGVHAASFSPDGRRIAALTEEGVIVWETQNPASDVRSKRARVRAAAVASEYNTKAWRVVVSPDASSADRTQALEWAQKAATAEPQNGAFVNTLGVALYRAGDYEGGLQTLRRSDALNSRVPGGERPHDSAMLALTLFQLGQVDEARQALTRTHRLMATRDWTRDGDVRSLLEEAETLIVGIPWPQIKQALESSDHAAAARWLDEALQRRRELLPERHPELAVTLTSYAEELAALGKIEAAEGAFREALAIQRTSFGDSERPTTFSMARLGLFLMEHGKATEAESLLREALEIREKKMRGSWRYFHTMSLLGGALAAQGKFNEAEPLLLEASANLQHRPPGPGPTPQTDYVRDAIERVVKLYDAWHGAEPNKGYDQKAAEWRAKLAKWQASASPPTTRASS